MKVNNEVREFITPIVEGMTRIYETNKHTSPLVGGQYDNENIKMLKRDCVHIILDVKTGKHVLAAKKTNEGKVVCAACGREISTEFGDAAQLKIAEAEKVINQLVTFGMMNGLDVKAVRTLVSIKHVLPDVMKLVGELGEFIAKSSTSTEALGDIGSEYVDTTGNSITSMR